MTFDQLAVYATLNGNTPALKRLGTLAKQAVGTLCPDCGSTETDSDCTGHTFVCLACDWQWDREAVLYRGA